MGAATLEQWLRWQEQLHPSGIELGLERVQAVATAMGLERPAPVVVTVAGTNGKGSCVAMLEAILNAAGYCTGVYTSPHLLRYNERVRRRGQEATDAELCHAFEAVERARGDTQLTYFEFGTLAALAVFAGAELDCVVLEVGLGGRLDAVNIVDADVALITAIGIDHSGWLGNDRDAIGWEKAGIMRAERPVVCGDPAPPASIAAAAEALAAPLDQRGQDFGYQRAGVGWRWWSRDTSLAGLPLPGLRGAYQLDNAAAVLMVLARLADRLPVSNEARRVGLRSANPCGRLQALDRYGHRLLDVAHNPQAAQALAAALAAMPVKGPTHLVLAMLADKDMAGVVAALAPHVDAWHVAGLAVPRGMPAETLAAQVETVVAGASVHCYKNVIQAYQAAQSAAGARGRAVVCGSFYTVAEILAEHGGAA